MFRRQRALIGLDVGSSAVKAVELRQSAKGYRIAAFGVEAIPPEAIVDGAVVDSAAVAGAIRRLFDSSKGFTTKNVCASLSGNGVIVKKLTLPVMTEAELSDSIYWEAEQYIPFDIQDVNLDYQVLDPGTAPGSTGMEVLLVAAKKERIADYASAITQAGRVPIIVDVDAFALQNAYEANYELSAGQVVVLLNAGASTTNVSILDGEHSIFTRNIAIGGNAYTEAVQKEVDLPAEAAEQLKKGIPVDGATYDDAEPVLRAVTENVLLEIQKTFDFFRATARSDRIDRIVLSGGATRVDGLRDALRERFETAVDDLDPFRAITWDAKALGAEAVDVAATAGVAVGLALRKVGDR